MAYDKFWMITNVADAYDGYRGEYIPEKQAPRFLHPYREQAKNFSGSKRGTLILNLFFWKR